MHANAWGRVDGADADPHGDLPSSAARANLGAYGLSNWEYTIADLFSDAGYATACFGKWHLGNSRRPLPY